jgi:hypothetical protein
MSETASLWTLFVSSFLAATLLPGGSEPVLFAVLRIHPELFWPALAAATLGNTLGGMSSYLIGRLIPQRRELKRLETVRQFGAPILLFSWVPILGDSLCVAALDLKRVHGCGEVRALRRDCVRGRPCCRGRSGRVMTAQSSGSLKMFLRGRRGSGATSSGCSF